MIQKFVTPEVKRAHDAALQDFHKATGDYITKTPRVMLYDSTGYFKRMYEAFMKYNQILEAIHKP